MRIYISYSPGSSIAFCFWKYFFRSCGVWVTPEKIGKDWRLDKSHKPHLVILDKKTRKKYESPSSNIVYWVKGIIDEEYQRRDDLIWISQWEKSFHDVLRQLFTGSEDMTAFFDLIDIFTGKYNFSSGDIIEEGLWSAAWFFHEIAQQAGNRDWDREIIEKADKAINALEHTRNFGWYHQYMRLYCRYLQCGVNRNSISRMYQCRELLEQCRRLETGGRNSALTYLIGKISLLTSTENKYTVFYFEEIADLDPQADILYDIGHIYETAYGDMSLALKYYQKAYQMDNDYYRALYKLAMKLERKEDWRGAIRVYSEVRRIIRRVELKNDVGVRDFEYEYKSCKRILKLCRQYIDASELEEAYENHIMDMKNCLSDYVNFKKLFQKMFLKENQSKKEAEMREVLGTKLDLQSCN